MLTRSRPRAYLAATVVAVLLLVGASSPSAQAGVAFKDLPTSNITNMVHWPNPGGTNSPQHMIVQLGLWIPLQMDNGLLMEAKIGNYGGYAFAQLRWVRGTGNFGGISNVFLVNGDNFPSSYPGWYDDGSKKVCTAGNDNLWGCTQLSDGSIWDQPQYNHPPSSGTSIIGAHVVTCYQLAAFDQNCKHWWLTAF